MEDKLMKLEPLNLEELRALRQAKSIRGPSVEPTIDLQYVLGIVERLESKINEIIITLNSDGEADINELEKKLNQVIEVLNAQSEVVIESFNNHKENNHE